ncbi:MAG: HD domain-containing protein [Clostridiales bacterium]|jgi:putative nucleotidyltransferase with HDIG domain|nr:HD domain-containing protein [Clostridiales bacterium]
MLKSRNDAQALLAWGEAQNPGKWAAHSRTVARAAETIANAAGLDGERAYISGLLHDIGRYEGATGLHHVYAGYSLLRREGFDDIAAICLSHSLPNREFAEGSGEADFTPEELKAVIDYLKNTEYNDYDKLIQLCDALGTDGGIVLMEKRLVDVTRRYGFSSYTLPKWNKLFEIKQYFDGLISGNVYGLFGDEIGRVTFED